jgi:hypothetical protein
MGKAINSVVCWQRMHDQALKAYLSDDKKHDWFQIMLNLEMNFWRRSNCGTNAHMLFCHDTLLKKRKSAMALKDSR